MLLSGYTLQWIEPIKTYYYNVVGLTLTNKQVIDLCLKRASTTELPKVDIQVRTLKLFNIGKNGRHAVTLSAENKKNLLAARNKLKLQGISDTLLIALIIQDAGKRYMELNRVS